MLALKQLSEEKFNQKIHDYAGILKEGTYLFDVRKKENNWLDEKVDVVTKGIIDFLKEYE